MAEPLRVATFNAALNRDRAGELAADLERPDDPQDRKIAAIVQEVDPDILLLNEFDHDPAGEAATLFRTNYLAVPQLGRQPVDYPYFYAPTVNTGVATGLDLDRDGKVGGPGDAQGYGQFEGQYGFLVLSKLPIQVDAIRSFQDFLWRDMPGALLPEGWYPSEALELLRLSSKTHLDVPIETGGGILHVLASHPTPPVFDGPEDRNGRRNHDEIRLFADYVAPDRSAYLVDDRGGTGGLAAGSRFVIVGDLNADPQDGDSTAGAAAQLTGHPLFDASLVPAAEGGREAAAQGRANRDHRGDPAADTADFREPPGNLRVDYVLPSRAGLEAVAAGIFWPPKGAEGADLAAASDHRLTWIDLELVPGPQGAQGGATTCTVGMADLPAVQAPPDC